MMLSQPDPGTNSLLLEEAVEKHDLGHDHNPRWGQKLWLRLHLFLFIANIFILIFILNAVHQAPNDSECLAQVSVYSPATEALTEVEEIYFDATFDATNLYKGTLSDQLDEAWHNISHVSHIAISEADVRKIGKNPRIAVKYPAGSQEESKPYAGVVEAEHQLHCLNTIRQYVHLDYYNTHSKFKLKGLVPKHIDHCIDVLRQVLMCNADTAIITLNWVTFMEHPTGDFSTKHKCRKFSAIKDWTISHAAKSPIRFKKEDGIVELDHYPVISDHQKEY